MPEPLTYVELDKAADNTLAKLYVVGDPSHAIVLAAFIDIAKRAFKQAARPRMMSEYGRERLVIGSNGFPVLLANALAALDAPDTDTPKPRTVPLTDAEVLKKLPPFIRTATGTRMTDEQLNGLIESIRWS